MQYKDLSEEERVALGNQILLGSVLRIRAQEEKDLKKNELNDTSSCLTNIQEDKEDEDS